MSFSLSLSLSPSHITCITSCIQFALMETVTTAILDKFPNLRQYKTWVVLFVGVFGYLGGLGFTTNVCKMQPSISLL